MTITDIFNVRAYEFNDETRFIETIKNIPDEVPIQLITRDEIRRGLFKLEKCLITEYNYLYLHINITGLMTPDVTKKNYLFTESIIFKLLNYETIKKLNGYDKNINLFIKGKKISSTQVKEDVYALKEIADGYQFVKEKSIIRDVAPNEINFKLGEKYEYLTIGFNITPMTIINSPKDLYNYSTPIETVCILADLLKEKDKDFFERFENIPRKKLFERNSLISTSGINSGLNIINTLDTNSGWVVLYSDNIMGWLKKLENDIGKIPLVIKDNFYQENRHTIRQDPLFTNYTILEGKLKNITITNIILEITDQFVKNINDFYSNLFENIPNIPTEEKISYINDNILWNSVPFGTGHRSTCKHEILSACDYLSDISNFKTENILPEIKTADKLAKFLVSSQPEVSRLHKKDQGYRIVKPLKPFSEDTAKRFSLDLLFDNDKSIEILLDDTSTKTTGKKIARDAAVSLTSRHEKKTFFLFAFSNPIAEIFFIKIQGIRTISLKDFKKNQPKVAVEIKPKKINSLEIINYARRFSFRSDTVVSNYSLDPEETQKIVYFEYKNIKSYEFFHWHDEPIKHSQSLNLFAWLCRKANVKVLGLKKKDCEIMMKKQPDNFIHYTDFLNQNGLATIVRENNIKIHVNNNQIGVFGNSDIYQQFKQLFTLIRQSRYNELIFKLIDEYITLLEPAFKNHVHKEIKEMLNNRLANSDESILTITKNQFDLNTGIYPEPGVFRLVESVFQQELEEIQKNILLLSEDDFTFITSTNALYTLYIEPDLINYVTKRLLDLRSTREIDLKEIKRLSISSEEYLLTTTPTEEEAKRFFSDEQKEKALLSHKNTIEINNEMLIKLKKRLVI